MLARMLAVVAVAGGGALGAVARYQLSLWIHGRWPGAFPTGTFVVNVVGCLALGLLSGVLDARATASPLVRLFAGVGILGAFTTFSTFELETVHALERGEAAVALGYVAASVLVGFVALWLGLRLGRLI